MFLSIFCQNVKDFVKIINFLINLVGKGSPRRDARARLVANHQPLQAATDRDALVDARLLYDPAARSRAEGRS